MSKKPKALERKIWDAIFNRPFINSQIGDKEEGLNIIRRIIAQHRNTSFSADDIRIFLATNLPRWYSDSDTDMAEEELIYIVKPEDIERVSLELFKLFKANGDN